MPDGEEEGKEEEGVGAGANFVVSSILFLRFLVPVFVSFELGGEGKKGKKKKGMAFLGKFLMKMCCGSLFPVKTVEVGVEGVEGGTLANAALIELRPTFDKFCLGVVDKGKACAELGEGIGKVKLEEEWREDLEEFVKLVEAEGDIEIGEGEPAKLWSCFKNTLVSKSVSSPASSSSSSPHSSPSPSPSPSGSPSGISVPRLPPSSSSSPSSSPQSSLAPSPLSSLLPSPNPSPPCTPPASPLSCSRPRSRSRSGSGSPHTTPRSPSFVVA